jgi:putative nucleotidyltransferase with HDIG domain
LLSFQNISWRESIQFRLEPVTAYAAILAFVTAVFGATLVASGAELHGPPWVMAALAITALSAERQSVRVGPHTEMSVSVLPIVFAAVVLGPLAAMIVGACALLGDFKPPYIRWAVWTCQRALVGGLAGTAAWVVGARATDFVHVLFAVAAAAVTEAVADGALTTLTAYVRGNNMADTTRSMARLQLAAVPLYTPVLAVLSYAFTQLSPWLVLFFFAPALAAQRLFLLYQEQRHLAEDLTSANERLERANLSFATALVATLDARDQYTAGHSAAVAVYARDIAERMGLDPAQQQLVHVCGLVHDIGKVGLQPGLLEKAGALTLEERRQMEAHPAIGERILAKVDGYGEIARIVRHHHERVDGHGYPDGLVGDEIPLLSKIIAVADAYNAMTSDRPYRDAMPSRVARLRLAQAVESQFDTSVVAAFEALLAGSNEAYRSGVRNDFTLRAQEPAVARAVALA